MDCIVHGVTKSWTQLSNFHFTLTKKTDEEIKKRWYVACVCMHVSDVLTVRPLMNFTKEPVVSADVLHTYIQNTRRFL